VSDFGLSTTKKGTQHGGTPFWMAPGQFLRSNRSCPSGDRPVAFFTLSSFACPAEVLKGDACSPASDMYAFAIVMFECVSRQDPYAEASEVAEDGEIDVSEVLRQVVRRKRRPIVPDTCPPEVGSA